MIMHVGEFTEFPDGKQIIEGWEFSGTKESIGYTLDAIKEESILSGSYVYLDTIEKKVDYLFRMNEKLRHSVDALCKQIERT